MREDSSRRTNPLTGIPRDASAYVSLAPTNPPAPRTRSTCEKSPIWVSVLTDRRHHRATIYAATAIERNAYLSECIGRSTRSANYRDLYPTYGGSHSTEAVRCAA